MTLWCPVSFLLASCLSLVPCPITCFLSGVRLKFLQQLHDQTVKEGNTARFELELSHEDVPVVWYRNELKVHVSRTVLTHVDGKRHVLEMSTLTLDDTCQIKAEAKGVFTEAKLTVIGNYPSSPLSPSLLSSES